MNEVHPIEDNIRYLWGSESDSSEFSDDPLEDLINEFGTEDPIIIQEEKVLFELAQNLSLKKDLKEITTTHQKTSNNPEEIISQAKKALKEFNYYNSYFRN